MKPKLGIVNKGSITQIKELNPEEYEECKNAIVSLNQFSRDRNLLTAVYLNYEDLQNLLGSYTEEYVKNPLINAHKMEKMFLNLNRLILNYLSSIRTFLDHSEYNIKSRHGKDSERVKRFSDATSYEYDNNFSYRFLYRLRNYSQHIGMPIGQLTLDSILINTYSSEVKHTLLVEFGRDELLKFDNWSTVRNEIQKLPSKFKVNPHITEMLKCIERINLEIIKDDLPDLMKNAEYLQQLKKQLKDIPGNPCILRLNEPIDKGEIQINIEWIPYHVVEIILAISNND